MNYMQPLSLVISAALLPGLVSAQSSAFCLPIGTNGAYGCQSSTSPVITGGVVATGDVDFQYDAGTGVLTLVVENTSPIVMGETNPVITRIGFNFPAGAVSSATLLSQMGSGGATPAFSLSFSASQSLRMGCLGRFNTVLDIRGVAGAIGNASAPVFSHPSVVLGPVTFQLQLAGSGLATLTANAIVTTNSQGGHPDVPMAMHFQAGGVNGAESGWVSSGVSACCLNQAQVLSIGAGCAPAASTIPTLTSIGAPVLGGPIGVDISSPSTPNGVGLLVSGFSSTFDPGLNLPLPIDLTGYGYPGCSIFASTEFSIGVVVDGNGDGTYSFNVPALQKWCEREITFQAFFLSSSSELLSSAGLTAVIGS